MGLLEKALVKRLLDLSPKQKRDIVEVRLVALFGGSQPRTVSHLSPRKGSTDGGLDGRVRVLVPNSLLIPSDNQPLLDLDGAFNIKIQGKPFSRAQLGAFVNDMDREDIRVGIIVTATGLSGDAESEIERHNAKKMILLRHVPLEEILSGNPSLAGIRFVDGELCDRIRRNLTEFLSSEPRSDSQEEPES